VGGLTISEGTKLLSIHLGLLVDKADTPLYDPDWGYYETRSDLEEGGRHDTSRNVV
jgi:hypothetical protein